VGWDKRQNSLKHQGERENKLLQRLPRKTGRTEKTKESTPNPHVLRVSNVVLQAGLINGHRFFQGMDSAHSFLLVFSDDIFKSSFSYSLHGHFSFLLVLFWPGLSLTSASLKCYKTALFRLQPRNSSICS
jgi:hypothetical protein